MKIKEMPRVSKEPKMKTVIPKTFAPTNNSKGPIATPKKNKIHFIEEKKLTIVFLSSYGQLSFDSITIV